MKLVKHDEENSYKLYELNYIVEKKQEFINECYSSVKRLQIFFPESSTRAYNKYNTFNLTSGSIIFYKLYKDLIKIIKSQEIKQPLWFQSWINFHDQDEVLDWHSHFESQFHGYVSIEPFQTKTVFENYKIKNKTGLLYIGPSNRKHKVVVKKPFEGKRITIAFDVSNQNDLSETFRKNGNATNLSYIPII